jgi:hypothetical protein
MPPPPDSVEVWDAQRVCSYEYIAVGEAREWIWEGPPTETAPEPSAVDSTAPSSSPFMVDGPAATVEAARSGDGELESINRAADELERWADRCRALVMELERKAAEEAEAAATGTDAKVKAMERRRLVALTVAATREAAPLGHQQAQQARGHDAAQLVAKMDEILARCPLAMAVLGGTPRPASPPPSTGTACHEAHETVETVVQAATVAGSESSSWHREPGVEDSDEEGAELWRRIRCHRSPSLVPPPLTEAEAAVTRKAARTEGGRTSAAQHHAISPEPDDEPSDHEPSDHEPSDHEPSDHEPSDHERGGARERPRRYSRAVTVVALATVSVMSMLLVMLAVLVLLAEYQAWTRGRARALHEMQGHGSTRAASVLGLPLANLRNGSRLKQMLKASWRPIALGVATISVTDVVGALVIPTVGAWAAPLVAPAIAELRGRTAAARRAIEATLRGEIQSKASARSAAASKATSRAQAASVARAAREGRARAAEVVKAAERAVKAAAAETKAAAAATKAAAAATKAAAEQAARDQATKAALRAARDKAAAEAVAATKAAAEQVARDQATKAALRAARDKAAAEAVAATKAAAEQAARDQATKAALRAARDKAAAEAVAATKAAAAATEAVAEATKTVVEQTARDQAAVASLSMAIANDATAQEAAAAAYEEAAARAVTIGRVNPSDTMTSEATDTTMSTEDARETAGTSHEQESDVSRSTGIVANDSMALQTVQRVKILSLAGRVAASLLHAAWGVARAWDSTTGFIQKKLPPLVDRLNSGLRNYGKNARGSA